jgi:signal transduction histidine kinase
MLDAASAPSAVVEEAAGRRARLAQALQWVVWFLLAATAVVYLAALALAMRWQQRPFLGAFVEITRAFNDQKQDEFPAFREGVKAWDRLLALDGVPIRTDADLAAELEKRAPGATVALTVQHREPPRETGEVRVTLHRFPGDDFFTYFILPYLIGFVYWLIGLWVFRQRRHEAAGRAFAVFCCAAAVTLGGFFDFYTTHALVWLWTLAVPGMGAALINLGLVFPQELGLLQKRPGLRLALCYLPLAALAAYTFSTYFSPDAWQYLAAWSNQNNFMALGMVFFLGALVYRWRSSASPIVREQSRIILIGAAGAASLILLWVAQQVFSLLLNREPAPLNVAWTLPLSVLFPAAVAYAILRYRLLETDELMRRGLVYAAMSVVALAGYSLMLTGASLLIGESLRFDNPLVLAFAVFLLVALFAPLRDRLQRLVDATFFRGSRAYVQRLEQFGRTLTRAAGLDDIVQALAEQIDGALKPAHVHIFLRNAATNEFAAHAPAGQPPTGSGAIGGQRPRTDVRFAADGALAAVLTAERATLVFTPGQPLPDALLRDRARLGLLGSAMYVPLPGKSGLSGWLAVGPKLSGEPFTREDLRFVESLADQSALAIERATSISDLEQKVKELNVLSQMAQAANFTTAYDDLLELVYAQASKVVDARNFRIILKDSRGVSFSYVFYVENNERVPEEERKPWPIGRGLATEIIRTGQPIRTDDYPGECRRRNVVPGPKPFRAWMGVPLNAGADTIGVMAAGAYEPSKTFTEDELKIFWAVADQAALAIVKARLFQQTEQRAKQLATLNEVSTSMASTLELDPLLQRIVQSSVDILSCEAGSLFLTDEETGEYVFRVAVGPVGQNLVGMRVAPGKGFVGEAVESGKALIVNDVQNDPRWFKGTDDASGFVTRALMVVPLRYQGRPIGAVEVINKRDGSPFGEEDQNLLTAFSGQAAVAIQNARLFTMTDQALAARVEELSVMQRIDRELNTALDMQRVMGLTLNWAMKNTGASAGSVGVVAENGLAVIATQGSNGSADQAPLLPLDRGLFGQVIQSGEISLLQHLVAGAATEDRLPSTRAQLVIPIKIERRVVGLINLESVNPDAFTKEQVDFVSRLLDHASVAITNARLYAEVNAANLAKSEFISFVAHELKTPMTSIRGYTDLLAGSAVGQINDMQKQFLGTIRGNVDRMATLVSDLADIARIESGRLRLEPKPIPFHPVLEDVVRTTQALIDAKKQTLRLDLEPDLPHVWADYTRLTQVLTNLMSNAYKYTPEGGEIVVRVARARNQWDASGAPEVLHVTVRDNGIGISPEDQKKLFQKFFRAEDRLAREMATGTGLGLNIVKNLIELQGGKIWFESELRKGSAFHFTIPIAAEEEAVSAGS